MDNRIKHPERVLYEAILNVARENSLAIVEARWPDVLALDQANTILRVALGDVQTSFDVMGVYRR